MIRILSGKFKIKNNRLLCLLAAGLLIRLIISITDYYHADIDIFHVGWVDFISKYGTAKFYGYNLGKPWATYPPIAIYFFMVMLSIYRMAESLLWQINTNIPAFPSSLIPLWHSTAVQAAFLKIPGIFADLGLAYFIYLFAKKNSGNKKSPIIFAALILFNPAIFYVSSLWGQIDTIPLFFTVAAFYFLYENKFTRSAIFMALGLLIKQTSALFFILYIAIFIYRSKWKDISNSLLATIPIFIIVFLPFNNGTNFIIYPFLTYFKLATSFASHWFTVNAFNIWWLMLGRDQIPETDIMVAGISVGLIAQTVVVIFTLIIIYILYRRKFKLEEVFTGAALISLGTFLFSTRMHERHLLPALPFLLLAATNNRKLWPIFIFTSIFHLINLYVAWGSPVIPVLRIMLGNSMLSGILILIEIGFFIDLLIKFLKIDKNYRPISGN